MKSILLIDDEEPLRRVFAVALRKVGYHVIEAEDGTSGLAKARQHLPDLILTDVHMPNGDGSALLRDIRQDPALSGKQVVLMTGRPDLVTPRKGMEEGADDFLAKPVSVKELVNCIAARFRRAEVSWRVQDQMLDRLKSHVPAQLPHEFFTPIAGIIGLAEILRDPQSGLSPDDLPCLYNDLYDSAVRLHRTMRNYLLILDLEAPADTGAAKPLSAVELERAMKEGVGEALRIQARRADVTLRVTPCPVSVKSADLARMVDELVHNACKFSRPGTPIEITLTDGGVLTVADKGRGMNAEEIGQIGAFQQFDRKKQEQQGLGVGLVLVQKLATRSGAKFSISSKPGDGTTVQVVLPLAS